MHTKRTGGVCEGGEKEIKENRWCWIPSAFCNPKMPLTTAERGLRPKGREIKFTESEMKVLSHHVDGGSTRRWTLESL